MRRASSSDEQALKTTILSVIWKKIEVRRGSDVTMWNRYYLTMKSSVIRFVYAMALVMAVVYAFVAMRGPRGVAAWTQKRQEIREMEERNAALSRENQIKREYIERLRKSQAEQELEIRRRLKLVKPNEKVFMKRPGE
jgi:cell division protein FtsB